MENLNQVYLRNLSAKHSKLLSELMKNYNEKAASKTLLKVIERHSNHLDLIDKQSNRIQELEKKLEDYRHHFSQALKAFDFLKSELVLNQPKDLS